MTDSRYALATDLGRQERLFGRADLLAMWVAEPYVPLSDSLTEAVSARAAEGWYGYETRPRSVRRAFWDWMGNRHSWDGEGLSTLISPSVGTSMAVLMDLFTSEGDGVIVQPPVFTEFKPLIRRSKRNVVTNPLVLGDDGYAMDLDHLAEVAAADDVRMMILCNPHNPVGRLWKPSELEGVARVCAENDVLVISDEIHADLALPPRRFTPFAMVVASAGTKWAATHGPIKTFGLAGVSDTLLVTDNPEIKDAFRRTSHRLHLNRNNVFSTAAFEAVYRLGGEWLDALLDLVAANVERLREGLAEPVTVMPHEATYLAWLDFRGLGLDVPELSKWLVDAEIAVSPGHWFGREGAGFARATIGVPPDTVDEAIRRINAQVASRA